MRRPFALLLLAAAVPAACADRVPDAPATAATLCAPAERTYFSCRVRSGQWVSLCGREARVQYRFGTPGRVELEYPPAPAQGGRALLYAGYHRAQMDRSEVRFVVGDHEYVVFDGQEDGQRQAGVAVRRLSNDVETVLPCRGPIEGRVATLESVLPCDPDSALSGGRCR